MTIKRDINRDGGNKYLKFNIIYNFNCDQQDRTQSGVCACGGVRACVSPKRPEDEAERTRLSLLEDKLTDSLTLLLQLRNMVLTHAQTNPLSHREGQRCSSYSFTAPSSV